MEVEISRSAPKHLPSNEFSSQHNSDSDLADIESIDERDGHYGDNISGLLEEQSSEPHAGNRYSIILNEEFSGRLDDHAEDPSADVTNSIIIKEQVPRSLDHHSEDPLTGYGDIITFKSDTHFGEPSTRSLNNLDPKNCFSTSLESHSSEPSASNTDSIISKDQPRLLERHSGAPLTTTQDWIVPKNISDPQSLDRTEVIFDNSVSEPRKSHPEAPSADTMVCDIPNNDIYGALESLGPRRLLSSTALELILNAYHSEGVRVFDDTYLITPPTVKERLRIRNDRLFVFPLHHTQPAHWTLAIIDLMTGNIDHYDSLKSSPCKGEAHQLTERFVKFLISQEPDFEKVRWRFESRDCCAQLNDYDCGIYVLVNALYRMLELPLPKTLDSELWRRAFTAYLKHKAGVVPDNFHEPHESSLGPCILCSTSTCLCDAADNTHSKRLGFLAGKRFQHQSF